MRHSRRNPARFSLCSLDNPKRWHKKTLRRSWRHRDRFHDAIDDMGWEKAARRKKHNPMPARRNCDMTFLSQEQEDRIVKRITATRNPRGGKKAARSWWRKLPTARRMKIARSVLGRMNPRSQRGRDFGDPSNRSPAQDAAFREFAKKKARLADARLSRRERLLRDREDKWINPHSSERRRNPKRDGSPTRGELRRVKYVDYLKTVIGKSEDARLEYQRLTATVAKAGAGIHKPVGPRAMRHAVKEHVESWKARHAAELAPQEPATVAEVVAEHPELKFITSRLSDIDATIAHFRDEITQLPQDDLSEDEEARLMEEIGKLARQKQKLRQKLTEIAPEPVMSNPRRRGQRRGRGRLSRSALGAIKRASDRCARAIRSLRTALRRSR